MKIPLRLFATCRDGHWRWLAFAVAAAKLWFVSAQPIIGLPGSEHDDQLFLVLADSLSRGEWLGEYSRFTLMKGCGYPVLIAMSFLIGLPLPMAENGLYLLGCWLLVRALRPLLAHEAWAFGLFALLVWQPMSYWVDPSGGNILRQNLYTPLTLLVFAGLIALHTRAGAALRIRLGWAALLGASFGWLWLTREESVWIFPSTAVLVATAAVTLWKQKTLRWPAIVVPPAFAALMAVLPILTVCSLNARHYGWFGTVEFRAPEFIAAYAALQRVRPRIALERVALPRDARERIYGVSPTFAQLRPLLEGEMGVRWSNQELEFNGGMWVWALREAVQTVRQPRNAREALEFYQQIAHEVNAACDAGRLPALPPRHSFLTPWDPVHTVILQREGTAYLRSFLSFNHFNARPPLSYGTAEQLRIFRDLTRWHLAFSPEAPEIDTPRSRSNNAWRIGALQDIGQTLRWGCIAVETLGAIAWLAVIVRSFRRRRWPGYLWWIASAALGGAFAVFTISLLIHVTAWGDWRPLRFAQAYPLLLLFGATAIAEFCSSFGKRLERATKRAPNLATDGPGALEANHGL